MKEYIDISLTISPEIPVWEGDPRMIVTPLVSIDRGEMANVSHIQMGVHIGTHIDAPIHFVAGRKGIDHLDLDTLIGNAFVVDLTDLDFEVTEKDFASAGIPQGTKRLLLKTRNSSLWISHPLTFYKEFIGISASGAKWLVDNNIALVGVDYLGVERFDRVAQGAPTHHILLEKEVIIIEGLNLSGVAQGFYDLICLPIKIKNSDGAPCRAILIKE